MQNNIINKELLKILACPKCKKDVYINKESTGIICKNCNLFYEIKDGIPIMLLDKAKNLKPKNLKKDEYS